MRSRNRVPMKASSTLTCERRRIFPAVGCRGDKRQPEIRLRSQASSAHVVSMQFCHAIFKQ